MRSGDRWHRCLHSRNVYVLLGVAVAVLIVMILIAVFMPWTKWLLALLHWASWVQRIGYPWGPLIYGCGYVVLTNVHAPGWILQIGAGFFFKFLIGLLTMNVSIPVSATLGSAMARYMCKTRVRRMLDKRWESMHAIDLAVSRNDWKLVLLIRLSPSFPFTMTNHMLGLSSARMYVLIIGTWLGAIPGQVLYVWIGASSRSLVEALSGKCSITDVLLFQCSDVLKDVVVFVGIFATLLFIIVVGMWTKRAIRRAVQEAESTSNGGIDSVGGGGDDDGYGDDVELLLLPSDGDNLGTI